MKTLTESILGSNIAGVKGRAEKWCEENLSSFSKYTVDDKGVISGKILITGKMEQLPDWIQWGEISEFTCSDIGLKTLKNSPRQVNGNFYCNNNNLTTLEGSPRIVKRDFECAYNQLTSLEGGPQKVGHTYYCSHNSLSSLKGAPLEIGYDFYCSYNSLTSLKGGPRIVKGTYYCHDNTNKFTPLEVKKHCKVIGVNS